MLRKLTMQRCIEVRQVKQCPHEYKEIGFDRYFTQ